MNTSTRSTPPSPKGKRIVKINALTQAHLIKLLLEGAFTCQELADKTGLHYVTVLQYTRELHRIGAAHISEWEKDQRGRDMLKIYKLGPGKDAKRRRMTANERTARHRAKARQLKSQLTILGALTCNAPSAAQSPTSC